MKHLLAALALMTMSAAAAAHGAQEHARHHADVVKEQKPWGIAAEPAQARRTITVDMSDDMRFAPSHIEVTQGETVRLRVRNRGKVLHELVLGTKQELDEHAALMKKFPDMEHDEPYMAHVDAGRQAEIVWTFNRAGDFWFACLLPGHYEAGMVGTIRVVPASQKR